jgi:Flp pilus assembly protein TadD
MVSYAEGDLKEAARQLQAAVDTSPSLAPAFAGLGLILENIGEKEGATSAYEQALHLDPDNFNARSGLARLSGAQTGESSESGLPADHPVATDSATEEGATP